MKRILSGTLGVVVGLMVLAGPSPAHANARPATFNDLQGNRFQMTDVRSPGKRPLEVKLIFRRNHGDRVMVVKGD